MVTQNNSRTQLPMYGPMLRISDAAQYLGLGRSTLYDMIAHGQLPPPIKLRSGLSVLPKSWLDAAVAARVQHTGRDAE